MNPEDFKNSKTGRLVPTIQGAMAFVPDPLPPPLLDYGELLPHVARAQRALGELSGIGRTLHNPYLLIRPFMRREAVASSKIEGTVTTLSELFLFELEKDATGTADAREVWNYVRALETSLRKLDELPISLRMIKEAHRVLLSNVASNRGAAIVPGELKTDQNWIGARLIQNARYVPPPQKEAEEGMYQLEKYMNADDGDDCPLIVKLALIHYQFEAIHPFPDGNGRVGRLLIPLVLCERKEISQPLLYMSPFFEKNYDEYIDRMLDVSMHGLWGNWIKFFLKGIEETCKDAVTKAAQLQDMQAEYHRRIQRARSSVLLGKIIDLLFEHPAITIPNASERLGIAYNAAKNNLDRLVEHQILRPGAENIRPKYYLATEIIDALSS